jgi:hypothetical protein
MNRALDPRRARRVGRPSCLKGRYRDRCATGPRPALDPRAAAALIEQRHGQAHSGARRARGAQPTDFPTNQVATVHSK